MLRYVCVALGLVLFLSFAAAEINAAPIPILEYRFNDSGTTSASSGSNSAAVNLLNSSLSATDLHGAAGSGVSGLAGDRAFNNTASTSMGDTPSTGSGGVARESGALSAVDSLTSFSIQGWFKTDSTAGVAAGNNASIVNNLSAGGFSFRSGSTGVMTLELATVATIVNSSNSYTGVGTWEFFAVTVNQTTSSNNVVFYRGTSTLSPTAVTTASVPAGNTGISTNPISIGNSNGVNRPLDALLDDVKIFGATSGTSGVLSPTDVASLWTADLANVPEPSVAGLVLIGLFGFGFKRRRSGGRQD